MENLEKTFTATISLSMTKEEIVDNIGFNTNCFDDDWDDNELTVEKSVLIGFLTDDVCQEYINGYILVENDDSNNDGYVTFHEEFLTKLLKSRLSQNENN